MKFLFITVLLGLAGLIADEVIKMPYEKGVVNGKNYVQPIRKAIDAQEEQAVQQEGALKGPKGEPMQNFENLSNDIHSGHGVKE